MAALTRSEHTTYCPYKGDASYYSIPAGGDRSLNAVWTYETPFEAMARIKDHVAFYPDRVDEISYRQTMVRKSELQDATCDEVDFENAVGR